MWGEKVIVIFIFAHICLKQLWKRHNNNDINSSNSYQYLRRGDRLAKSWTDKRKI
jgi:hypothetical protein